MEDISKSTKKKAYITVRRTGDNGTPESDGIITKRKTFQKYSTPPELEKYAKKYFNSCEINKYITNANSSSVICKNPKL